MRTVVVNEQGAQIALKGGELVVAREKALLARVRLAEIAQVVAMGSIELTSAARAELLKRGIDTVFLTQRGQYRGRLVGAAHGNVELRIAQYRRLLDPLQAAAAARSDGGSATGSAARGSSKAGAIKASAAAASASAAASSGTMNKGSRVSSRRR